MKIIKILPLLMFFSLNSYASNCTNDLSDNYFFKYNMEDNHLSYNIKNKKNNLIKYLNKIDNNYSSNLGFIIVDKGNEHNNTIYSTKLFRGNSILLEDPYWNKDFFTEKKDIQENIDMDDFINQFRPIFKNKIKSKEITIKFVLTLILDPETTQCAVFETKPINYKLTNEFIYNLASK